MKRYTKSTVIAAFVAAALGLFVVGCKDAGPSARAFVKNDTNRPLRVAVIPFENVTRDANAGKVVTNTVLIYLLSTGVFEVMEPGVLDEAMASATPPIREASGTLKPKDCQYLAEKLEIDAILVGAVEDYGEIRISNDTYPSVSFSARLVNARTGEIVWADAISKTGSDKETLFGLRRVSSLGKLCKLAVADMAASMAKHGDRIVAHLRPASGAAPAAPIVAETPSHGTTVPAPMTQPVTAEAPAAPVAPEPTVVSPDEPVVAASAPTAPQPSGRSADESIEFAEADLKALLLEVDGFQRSAPVFKKHFHSSVEARYTIGDGPQFVDVRLTDYQKLVVASKFMEHYNKGTSPTTFTNLAAYVYVSGFGYQHIDIPLGRFGLFAKGPEMKKDSIEKLARELITALQ